MSERVPIITLTTDFGLSDYYVSAMKGVILGIAPSVRLIDVSHDIASQDVMAAAWVLKNTAFLYPKGTVHLAVVDPGVGTSRRPLVIHLAGHYFVGPDNGLFSLLTEDMGYVAYELDNKKYWRNQLSETFHGRDIFAPVAAHLISGTHPSELGSKIDEITSFRWAIPIADKDGVQGWVLHIDKFGNLITNISHGLIKEIVGSKQYRIYVGNTIIRKIVRTFADVSDGDSAGLIGSSGMLEIIVNKGNAAELLDVRKGAPVSLIFDKNG